MILSCLVSSCFLFIALSSLTPSLIPLNITSSSAAPSNLSTLLSSMLLAINFTGPTVRLPIILISSALISNKGCPSCVIILIAGKPPHTADDTNFT